MYFKLELSEDTKNDMQMGERNVDALTFNETNRLSGACPDSEFLFALIQMFALRLVYCVFAFRFCSIVNRVALSFILL